MAARLPSSAFASRYELPDWRILLRRIEAWFDAPSFHEAGAFVDAVVAAAEAADHHPSIDLRYPGRVHVLLTSHDAAGLTDRDARLAERISVLAAERSLVAAPRRASALEVAIDALDIPAVLPFWQAVLAYDVEPAPPGQEPDALVDPHGVGPAFWFQQMDAPRAQRNRIHLDVIVSEDEVDDRIAAALAAGGTMLSDERAKAFWVLADAEGNEACLCTWQDRG